MRYFLEFGSKSKVKKVLTSFLDLEFASILCDGLICVVIYVCHLQSKQRRIRMSFCIDQPPHSIDNVQSLFFYLN